ncbi:proton pump interactor 1 [Wolffia australiana]
MGVEVLTEGFTSPAAEDTTELTTPGKPDQPDIQNAINFGSVDSSHEGNGVAVDAKNDMLPKDAVDEWPAPKQVHTFYFVRYQPYEDPKLKARFDQIDKEIQKWNKERSQIMDSLKQKRAERGEIISQLKPLTQEDKQFRMAIDEKRKEMEPLQAALGKLRDANSVERGMGICSSEEELDYLIQGLQYRIQHESNTLSEEKQFLKDIKNLEATRERVIAYAAMRAKLQESLGPKEAIQDQVKLIGVGLDGVRKEKNVIRSKIKSLEDTLKFIDEDIASLQEDLTLVTQKRDKTFETLNELRRSRDEGNASYYQYRATLNNARDLAKKKDVAGLEALCNDEVSKFIDQWCRDKVFREDYEKRILPSLDKRQLTRDGRMRNPDEKPIFAEAAASVKEPVEAVQPMLPLPARKKADDRDPKQPKAPDVVVAAAKEEGEKPAEPRTKTKSGTSVAEAETAVLPEKPSPAAAAAAAAAEIEKQKEMKRDEEIAKAKQAQERKKRLAEKAAAKAAARAQKEAEKKQKEKEKKAKKKAEASAPDSGKDDSETDAKAEDTQESDEAKEVVVPSKVTEQKKNLRHRGRAWGADSRPRVVPRKKKTQPYWKWAAIAFAVLVALAVLGFVYYMPKRS